MFSIVNYKSQEILCLSIYGSCYDTLRVLLQQFPTLAIIISKGIVKGELPRKALKKVFEWMDEHHEELMANWARLQNGEEALPIDPLK